jgi:hypothetical protein
MAADFRWPGSKGRARRARDQAGQVQTFRSPTALVIWVVWLLFAVANWIDLAVQGRDHLSAIAAAILLLVTGIAYAAAQRPRIIADDTGLTIVNPIRDHRISWTSVSKVDLIDVLRVHTEWAPPGSPPDSKQDKRIISSWAVHYSRRRQFAADARARRSAGRRRPALGLPYGTPASGGGASAEQEAEKVVDALTKRATAARAGAVWASDSVPIAGASQPNGTSAAGQAGATGAVVGTLGALGTPGDIGMPQPPVSTWSWPAIAAIVIPALILLVVWLV